MKTTILFALVALATVATAVNLFDEEPDEPQYFVTTSQPGTDHLEAQVKMYLDEICSLATMDDSYNCTRSCLENFLRESLKVLEGMSDATPENVGQIVNRQVCIYKEFKECSDQCPFGELKAIAIRLTEPMEYVQQNCQAFIEHMPCVFGAQEKVLQEARVCFQGNRKKRSILEPVLDLLHPIFEDHLKGLHAKELVAKLRRISDTPQPSDTFGFTPETCQRDKCYANRAFDVLLRECDLEAAELQHELTKKLFRMVAYFQLKRLGRPEDSLPVECQWFSE